MTQPSDAVDNSVPELTLEDRVENRSHRPSSDAFKKFMGSNWQQPQQIDYQPDASASYAAQRLLALSRQFPTDRLVIPAGAPKVRSNDTYYRFRPHSAFAHLTGLGVDHEPEAVFVMQPVASPIQPQVRDRLLARAGGQKQSRAGTGRRHTLTAHRAQQPGRREEGRGWRAL